MNVGRIQRTLPASISEFSQVQRMRAIPFLSVGLLTLFASLVDAQGTRQPAPVVNPDQLVLSLNGKYLMNTKFLEEGRVLATIDGDNKLRIWDLDRGTHRGEVSIGIPSNNHGYQFLECPDGKRVIVAGNYEKAYVVNLADVKVLREIPQPREDFPVSYALRDGGKTLARLDRNIAFQHYDIETGKLQEGVKFPAPPKEAALTSDGRLVLAPDGKTYTTNDSTHCELRDSETHEIRYTFKHGGEPIPLPRVSPYSPMYSADSQRMVVHNRDGSLRVVDVATGKEIRSIRLEPNQQPRLGRPSTIAPVAFAPNGQWILVTTEGMFSELLLIGVTSGLEVRRFPAKVVGPTTNTIALSAKGNLLVAPGSKFDLVEIWDMAQSQIQVKSPGGK